MHISINMLYLIPLAILLFSPKMGLFQFVGLIRIGMRITESSVVAYEAFNHGDYLVNVKEMVKLGLDVILVVGVGRMLDRTGRVSFKGTMAMLLLVILACSHQTYFSSDFENAKFTPWSSSG